MLKEWLNGNRWGRFLLIGLAATLLLAACSAGGGGNPASDHAFETLSGETHTLAEFEGDVVVVNFWATWCGPCRAEMPELQTYYDAHRNDDFAMFVVNAGEPTVRAQDFIDEFGFTFPVGLDPEGELGDLLGGLRGMPTTFVIDKNGEIVYTHAGVLNHEVLYDHVTPLLKQ